MTTSGPGAPAARDLRRHRRPLVFARLPPGQPAPPWAQGATPLTSVAWNAMETSVLAPADVVPAGVDTFGPWEAFEVEGPVDFLLTGVLSGLIAPLAAGHIAVTTVSTYTTDWILVPAPQAEQAVNVWRYHGHAVHEADPNGPAGAAGPSDPAGAAGTGS